MGVLTVSDFGILSQPPSIQRVSHTSTSVTEPLVPGKLEVDLHEFKEELPSSAGLRKTQMIGVDYLKCRESYDLGAWLAEAKLRYPDAILVVIGPPRKMLSAKIRQERDAAVEAGALWKTRPDEIKSAGAVFRDFVREFWRNATSPRERPAVPGREEPDLAYYENPPLKLDKPGLRRLVHRMRTAEDY